MVFLIVLFPIGGTILAWVLGTNVHRFAFYGKSRSAVKKIVRAEKPVWRRILLLYTLNHNNRGLTILALICYYIFCCCSLIFWIQLVIGTIAASVFWLPGKVVGCILVLWCIAFLLSTFSLLFSPYNRFWKSWRKK